MLSQFAIDSVHESEIQCTMLQNNVDDFVEKKEQILKNTHQPIVVDTEKRNLFTLNVKYFRVTTVKNV